MNEQFLTADLSFTQNSDFHQLFQVCPSQRDFNATCLNLVVSSTCSGVVSIASTYPTEVK